MLWKFPNNLQLEEDKDYRPAFMKEFPHFMYFPIDTPIDDADFGDWVLGLFKKGSIVAEETWALTADVITIDFSAASGAFTIGETITGGTSGATAVIISEISGTLTVNQSSGLFVAAETITGGTSTETATVDGVFYRFYTTMTISPSVGARDCYFLAVYNTVTSDVKYVHPTGISVIEQVEIEEFAFLQYRNSSNIDNYNYVDFSQYNTVFIDMNMIDQNFEYTNKGYRERSTGKFRHQKNQRHKAITFETYLFDEHANDTMASVSLHDDVLINAENVTVKSGHEQDSERDFNLNKGTIVFYVDKFSTINLKT